MPQRMVYVRDSNGQPIPIQVEVDTGTGILLCKLLANSGIDIGDVDVTSLPGTSEVDIRDILTAVQLIDNFISANRGLVTEDNSADIKTAAEAAVNAFASSCPTGTKTCGTTKARLKAATLANTISLTVKVRSMGDASYVGVGDTNAQEFQLTSVGDSVNLDVDPYAVYVIDNHTGTAAVLEYIARVTT